MNEISVIIPVYNREKFITRAIDSVLKQAHPAGEIITVDDGSTDNTGKILQKYNGGIKIITINHSGVSKARNTGIKNAKYGYIAFLDSDDEWHETKLELQFDYMLKNPGILISHTNEKWIRNGIHVNKPEKYKKYGGYVFENCLPVTMIGASTVIMKKALFEKIGYFDKKMPVCEDYDLWLRVCAIYKTGLIDKPLTVKHAGHKGQLSMSGEYLDELRFYALEKFLHNHGVINKHQERSARAQLKRFGEIMITGLEKKNKQKEILEIKQRLELCGVDF